MSYCTLQDMVDRFGESELIQLTDRDGLNEIGTAIVDRAIEDASAVIDGYLASVYPLPLATVPPQLVRINCDVARYYLHANGSMAPESIEKPYDHAIKYLMAMANGTVSMEVATEDAQTGTISQSTPTAIFDTSQTNWP